MQDKDRELDATILTGFIPMPWKRYHDRKIIAPDDGDPEQRKRSWRN